MRIVRVVALLLALAPAAVAADEADPCLACHANGTGPAVDGAAFAASAHATFGCTTCHEDAATVPHQTRPGRPALSACAACHADAVSGWTEGVHGKASARGAVEAAGCRDCHGAIHGVRPHTEAASPAHWGHVAGTCARCHGDRELAEKFRIPVVRPVEAYLASTHARAVAAGKRAAVCSDCHEAHRILPGSDPRAPIWRTNVPETCGRCHADVLAAYRDSVHGEALGRGVRDAPVCTDCHGEHRILASLDPASPVFAANIPRETCGRCHGDARLSEKYGLSRDKVQAFEDSFHGLALRAGRLTVANCSTCHGVHDIRPSSDPRSRVHPATLPRTCGKCHPGAGTRFALGPVHVVADRASAPAVYWIRIAYLWLIGLTIGGMILHNGLDLGRKARRGSAAPRSAGPVPERMSRPLRWQHGLVMVSFPVLVYTGFALTYPDAWWAAPLLHWESGIGLRGLTHRVAAVVLLLALLWHAGHVAASTRLRACLRGLRPGMGDVRAFLAALVRGTRPPAPGPFSYIEKAEYWAFVWGTVVMAASGFLLWFENPVLRHLPKWVTDVATTVHFWEAVLATLAILVWHLYWVIFDPDVYPMDWSWWDGRPPAARVAEREAESEPDASTAAFDLHERER